MIGKSFSQLGQAMEGDGGNYNPGLNNAVIATGNHLIFLFIHDENTLNSDVKQENVTRKLVVYTRSSPGWTGSTWRTWCTITKACWLAGLKSCIFTLYVVLLSFKLHFDDISFVREPRARGRRLMAKTQQLLLVSESGATLSATHYWQRWRIFSTSFDPNSYAGEHIPRAESERHQILPSSLSSGADQILPEGMEVNIYHKCVCFLSIDIDRIHYRSQKSCKRHWGCMISAETIHWNSFRFSPQQKQINALKFREWLNFKLVNWAHT